MANHYKKRRKNSATKKFLGILLLVAVFIITIILFWTIGGMISNPKSSTKDEITTTVNNHILITITIKGERIYYNDAIMTDIDELREKLMQDHTNNTTVSLIDDGARPQTYDSVTALLSELNIVS